MRPDTGPEVGADTSPPDTSPPDDGGDADGAGPCPPELKARISAAAPRKSVTGIRDGTIQVHPLSKLSLETTEVQMPEAEPWHVQWTIMEKPENTFATFDWDFEFGSELEVTPDRGSQSGDPTLYVGLAGTYVVELSVSGREGVTCDTARLQIDARPTSELYIDFRYPFQSIPDADDFGTYDQSRPWVSFRFKRTTSADWRNRNEVIPNFFATWPNDQDWGDPDDEADDPKLGNLLASGGTNRYVALDGVESSTTYVGALRAYGKPDRLPVMTQTRIYIDGTLRKTIDQGFSDEPHAVQLFRVQKVDGSIEIRETGVEIEHWPDPAP